MPTEDKDITIGFFQEDADRIRNRALLFSIFTGVMVYRFAKRQFSDAVSIVEARHRES